MSARLSLAQSREVFLPVLGRGAQKADLLAGARPAPSHTAEPMATRTVTPTATPTCTPTRTPRPTGPTPTQAAGAVLFQDDFSDPGSGWRVDDGAQNSKRYVDDEYEISIHEAELFVAPFAPGLTCADCTIEAALGPRAAPPREGRAGGDALEAEGELAGRALSRP